jgi:hypothetical protein
MSASVPAHTPNYAVGASASTPVSVRMWTDKTRAIDAFHKRDDERKKASQALSASASTPVSERMWADKTRAIDALNKKYDERKKASQEVAMSVGRPEHTHAEIFLANMRPDERRVDAMRVMPGIIARTIAKTNSANKPNKTNKPNQPKKPKGGKSKKQTSRHCHHHHRKTRRSS